MRNLATNAGQRWTQSDEDLLRRLARQKLSTDEIARRLRRTVSGVRSKASELHISLEPPN